MRISVPEPEGMQVTAPARAVPRIDIASVEPDAISVHDVTVTVAATPITVIMHVCPDAAVAVDPLTVRFRLQVSWVVAKDIVTWVASTRVMVAVLPAREIGGTLIAPHMGVTVPALKVHVPVNGAVASPALVPPRPPAPG